jgi:hypothetical protein
MAAATLPGYFKRACAGTAAAYAFSGWLPMHHRGGMARQVWLLFSAPATDITTALEGASFVMQRPAGQWERIPVELGAGFAAKLQDLVQRKWLEARVALN